MAKGGAARRGKKAAEVLRKVGNAPSSSQAASIQPNELSLPYHDAAERLVIEQIGESAYRRMSESERMQARMSVRAPSADVEDSSKAKNWPMTDRFANRPYWPYDPIDPNDTTGEVVEGLYGRRASIHRSKRDPYTGKSGYVVKIVEPGDPTIPTLDGTPGESVRLHRTDDYRPAMELAYRFAMAEDAAGQAEDIAGREARRAERLSEKAPSGRPSERGTERAEDYAASLSGVNGEAEIFPILDESGLIREWEVRAIDMNGRRRIDRVGNRGEAQALAESSVGVLADKPLAAPRRAQSTDAALQGGGTLHGPWEEPKEGSAAERLLQRLNMRRWGSVTTKGPKRGLSTSGDMPTLEYIRSILQDRNNPEAAQLINFYIGDKRNKDWINRFDESDLRPGETKKSVIAEIKAAVARDRLPSSDGEPSLSQTPASQVPFREQPSLSRRGDFAPEEVDEIKRRGGASTTSRRRPPFTRDSHHPTDLALQRADYERLPQRVMEAIFAQKGARTIDDKIASALKAGVIREGDVERAKTQAEDILKLTRARGDGMGGSAQTHFDRTVQRATGTAPHERIVIAGGDPSDLDDIRRTTEATVIRASDGTLLDPRKVDYEPQSGDKKVTVRGLDNLFARQRASVDRALRRKEIDADEARERLADIDYDEKEALRRAEQIASQDVVSARTVGLKEFDGHGYSRGASTQTRLNALDRLIGESKRHAGVYLPASYSSPESAAKDILNTVVHNPEGLEFQGIVASLKQRYRGHKWADAGTAVRGEGAGSKWPRTQQAPSGVPDEVAEASAPSPTPENNKPTSKPESPSADSIQDQNPVTNPLPEGGSPVGIADDITTEEMDMGAKGGAAKRGKKSADVLRGVGGAGPTGGTKGGKGASSGVGPGAPFPKAPNAKQRKMIADERAAREAAEAAASSAVGPGAPFPAAPNARQRKSVEAWRQSQQAAATPSTAADPITNPLPEGGSPVGVAEEAPVEVDPRVQRFRRLVDQSGINPPPPDEADGFLPGAHRPPDLTDAQRRYIAKWKARKAADEAIEADRVADPTFWESVEGGAEFDPNPIDEFDRQAQGGSQRIVRTIKDVYGPTPVPPYPKPQPSPPAGPQPSAPAAPAAPPPAAMGPALPGSPPVSATALPPAPEPMRRWPDMGQGRRASDVEARRQWPDMGQSRKEATRQRDVQEQAIRESSGERASGSDGPAARDVNSPGMIRRLLKMLVPAGIGGGAAMYFMRDGSDLDDDMEMSTGMPPSGTIGGYGSYAESPNVLIMSPAEARVLEAQMKRSRNQQNNGFQTSYNFGR